MVLGVLLELLLNVVLLGHELLLGKFHELGILTENVYFKQVFFNLIRDVGWTIFAHLNSSTYLLQCLLLQIQGSLKVIVVLGINIRFGCLIGLELEFHWHQFL